MDLSRIHFLPKRTPAPAGVAEKWNARLDELFGSGKFRFVFGGEVLVCDDGSWRMKYPDVNVPTQTVIHYTLSTVDGPVEVNSAESRDWPEHLRCSTDPPCRKLSCLPCQYERSILLPIVYQEQTGVERWILEGFIGNRTQGDEPEDKWSELARVATPAPKREYREPTDSDIAWLQRLVRLQEQNATMRDVRWDSGVDHRVGQKRLERDDKIHAEKEAKSVAAGMERGAKTVEELRKARVIFNP